MGGRALPNFSLSSNFLSRSLYKLPSSPFISSPFRFLPSQRFKTASFPAFRTRCFSTETSTTTSTTVDPDLQFQPMRHSLLLEKMRTRLLRDAAKNPQPAQRTAAPSTLLSDKQNDAENTNKKTRVFSSFRELGLGEEVMGAVDEMGISVPTEIQSLGIAAVLEGKSVVLGSHTGSGKTLAYMLPLVQLLRCDEALSGMLMKPRRPRAVVLCPTRELSEQVYRVAKSICHHARFRATMVSGGGRLRPQEDSLNVPVDMVVGTPGRVLQHIEEGNMVYGDLKYLVLDEADTMFDRGFGPDIRKFLGPLKNRALKPGDQGFQTILVTATMTKAIMISPSSKCNRFLGKPFHLQMDVDGFLSPLFKNLNISRAVQKLVDEEFHGIIHLRTSSLHKKIASARHDFIKLSGSENKLESLLQVLEPSLAKGNRVMVFCNTLNSSRAVDHFLMENQIFTVNYHGEVPAEQRVENLKKFKSEDGDCPTLVCTDLAARGLDLHVDHVIMFDFPLNSIDYLHRTGRTARMGAKGKVTSLVAKKDLILATRIEEAIRKNESLELLTADGVRRDVAKAQTSVQKGKKTNLVKVSNQKSRVKGVLTKSPKTGGKAVQTSGRKTSSLTKVAKASSATKIRKAVTLSKPLKSSSGSPKKESPNRKKQVESRKSTAVKSTLKLNVVGFRGRSSSMKKESLRPS